MVPDGVQLNGSVFRPGSAWEIPFLQTVYGRRTARATCIYFMVLKGPFAKDQTQGLGMINFELNF